MTSQPLGSQTIQGIGACGLRNTITQKDGSPGLTTETWFSREDIGGALLLKDSNPQSGQNITQLVNVKFSEPDPGLFVPPANYRVIDETESFTFTEPAPASQTSEHQPARAARTIVALTGMPWSGDLMSGGTMISTNYRDSMGRTRSNVSIVDPGRRLLLYSRYSGAHRTSPQHYSAVEACLRSNRACGSGFQDNETGQRSHRSHRIAGNEDDRWRGRVRNQNHPYLSARYRARQR